MEAAIKRTIAKEWLWLLSMLTLGAIVAPLILYGFSTYHYDYSLKSCDAIGIDEFMKRPIQENSLDGIDPRFLYDALHYRNKPVGTYKAFVGRIVSDSSYHRSVFYATANYWDIYFLVVPSRVEESGHRLFFDHVAEASHYLLLIAPYLICVFCRFTYWSVRTTLSTLRKHN